MWISPIGTVWSVAAPSPDLSLVLSLGVAVPLVEVGKELIQSLRESSIFTNLWGNVNFVLHQGPDALPHTAGVAVIEMFLNVLFVFCGWHF